jgi:Protein of unknown function (DUF1569)
MTGERRTLTFASMAEVMPEVDRLLAGHRTVGNWSLGQICNHLAATIRLSVEGFPTRAPWVLRKTIMRYFRRRVLLDGWMPEGAPLAKRHEPRPGLDARAEAEALRATIRLFAAEAGPMAEHPSFGKFSAEEWQRFHCIHCAHHLGFVLPDPVKAA